MLRSAGPAFLLRLLHGSNIPNHNIVLSIWMQSRVEEQQFSTAERPSAQSSSATAARTRKRLPTPSSTRRLKKDSRNFNYAPYTSPHTARSGQRAGCPPKGLKPNTSRSRKAKGEPPFSLLILTVPFCPEHPQAHRGGKIWTEKGLRALSLHPCTPPSSFRVQHRPLCPQVLVLLSPTATREARSLLVLPPGSSSTRCAGRF